MGRHEDPVRNGTDLLAAALVSFFAALVAASGQGWFAALLFVMLGVALALAALLSKG